MADLTKIKKDGSETGATVADKINTAFTKIDTASTEVAKRVEKVTGKGLSTKDYTTADATKVALIDGFYSY